MMQKCAFNTVDEIFFTPSVAALLILKMFKIMRPLANTSSVMVIVLSVFSKLFVRWRHIRSRQFM